MFKLHAGAVAVAALALLFGCTPSVAMNPTQPTTPLTSPTTSAAPTASPSPTWDADQLAALEAVDGYRAASRKIAADPSHYSEKEMRALLATSAGDKVLSAAVTGYLDLKRRGLHYVGDTVVVKTWIMDPSRSDAATEVVVTKCLDQRELRVVDATGASVSETELGYAIPKWNLRQYTVQKRTGSTRFLVFGLAPTKGECGP